MTKTAIDSRSLPALPATSPTPQPVRDPNWGRGGSYVRNPTSGARVLRERTDQCPDCTLTPTSKG